MLVNMSHENLVYTIHSERILKKSLGLEKPFKISLTEIYTTVILLAAVWDQPKLVYKIFPFTKLCVILILFNTPVS